MGRDRAGRLPAGVHRGDRRSRRRDQGDGVPALRLTDCLFEAIAWDQIGRARLERLDAARGLPDVIDATRCFLRENCLLFREVGPILRAMLEVEREEPEIAAVLSVTYRGRRLESLRQLAERIANSEYVAAGWTVNDIRDALAILTGVEAFEALTAHGGRTATEAAAVLYSMTHAFLTTE